MSEKKIKPVYDILATLVLYGTSLEQSLTFKTLSESLRDISGKMDILVYDNSPTACTIQADYEQWNVHYVHNPENPGVSAAYNEGYKLADKLKKNWMLLLDQDTQFPVNVLPEYLNAIKLDTWSIVAPILKSGSSIISPFRHFYGMGRPSHYIQPGTLELDKWSVVNSGLLLKTEAFKTAGGYNNDIRLDYADISFMNRLKKYYSELFIVNLIGTHGFFAHDQANNNELMTRFKLYCQGAKAIYRETGNIGYLVMALARTLKLTYRHRHFGYLNLFFRT